MSSMRPSSRWASPRALGPEASGRGGFSARGVLLTRILFTICHSLV